MAMRRPLEGPRLPYVVRPLEGTIKREICTWDRRKGKVVKEMHEEPAGFLVMFPRGHYLRMSAEQLRFYKLNRKPRPIAGDGMPLHPTQRPEVTFENMERDVYEQVRAVSGTPVIPGYEGKLNLPRRVTEEEYA